MSRSTCRLLAEIHEEAMNLVRYIPDDPELRTVVLGLADEFYGELIAEYFGQPLEQLIARSPRYRDAVHRWMPSVAA